MIQSATSKLAAAASTSTAQGATPTSASTAVATAPSTMATALTMLLAAIMRETSPGAERSCIMA